MFGFRRKSPEKHLDGFGIHGLDIVHALVDGEGHFFEQLKAQLEEPFFAAVRRIPLPGEYTYQFSIRESLAIAYAATDTKLVNVRDLEIYDARFEEPWLPVVGNVFEGILVSFYILVPGVGDWPDGGPRASEIRYLGTEGPARDGSDQFAHPPNRGGSSAPVWLQTPLLRQIERRNGLTAEELEELEEGLEHRLPEQIRQLLLWSDGITVSGVKIFGSTELYTVDLEDGTVGITFNIADSGGLSVLRCGPARVGEVDFIDVRERRVEPLARSLLEWLENVSQRPGGG